MASGRVGGTKSLKSGKVGDSVLQIVENPDGTYSQVISQYVPTKAQTKTIKLAVQQMCTAMVQAMMRDLKPLGSVGFQSGTNKSKSLNAFSSYNLYKVAREAKDYWSETHDFEFATKGERMKVGGRWILSSGTLKYDCFGGYFGDGFNASWIDTQVRFSWAQFGVWFAKRNEYTTIGAWMDSYKLTYSTEIWIGVYYSNQNEDSEGQYCYCQITLNPKVGRSLPNTEANLENLIQFKSNKWGVKGWCRPTEYMTNRRHALCVGFRTDAGEEDFVAIMGKAFTITYINGRKQISSAVMDWLKSNHDVEWGYWRYPANCVSSWTDPTVPAPVPNPY